MSNSQSIRWGIIGTGNIANIFAADLAKHKDHTLYGVVSRKLFKSARFKEKHQVLHAYDNISLLLKDKKVDIIYIATPHDTHAAIAIECMQEGKAVLVEKPATINSKELEEVISLSEKKKIFFMEGLWSRFNPAIIEVLERIKHYEIGEINSVDASFCFHFEGSQNHRLVNPALAGGALLDVGIYPIFLVYMILGLDGKINLEYELGPTGVDLHNRIKLTYPKAIATIESAINKDKPITATIKGTKGSITIHQDWYKATSYTLSINGKKEQKINVDKEGTGFIYEAEACRKALQSNMTSSSLWSHSDSLKVMNFMDTIRQGMKLVYPMEKE